MNVQDVMISPARSCTPDAAIVDAARTMWDHHCGALPVLDEKGSPVGIITDRDICMALVRKNRFPARISVREVMTPYPFVCQPQDAVEEALATMAEYRVRRLPVVNAEGHLIGIVSISDVAAALPSGRQEVRGADAVHRRIARTLRTISAPKGAGQIAALGSGDRDSSRGRRRPLPRGMESTGTGNVPDSSLTIETSKPIDEARGRAIPARTSSTTNPTTPSAS